MACNLLCVKVKILAITRKRKVSTYKSLNKSMKNRWKFLERDLSINANCWQVSKNTFFVDDVLDDTEISYERLILIDHGIEKVLYFLDTIYFSKMVIYLSNVL